MNKPPDNDSSVTLLRCNHTGWLINACAMTPAVAVMCAFAVEFPYIHFLTGFAVGVWVGMWNVVLWAWATRKNQN